MEPKSIKITIIGNSVALRVRPKEVGENRMQNKVYGSLFRIDSLFDFEVVNLSKTRWIVTEFKDNPDLYLSTFPDYFILNIGCVDAPPREMPLWISDILFRRKKSVLFTPFDFVYRKIVKKYLRKTFVILRRRKPWVREKLFIKAYKEMIDRLKSETTASIIALGINRGNKRIENALPGCLKNYEKYNSEIRLICESRNIHFIDVSDLESENFFPDGVHYNSRGHMEIFSRIYSVITQNDSVER